MNRHYVDLGSASDCLKFASTNQKYYPDLVNARHHYAISALVSQTLFRGKTSGDMAKCRLFFQAMISYVLSSRIIFLWKNDVIATSIAIVFNLIIRIGASKYILSG